MKLIKRYHQAVRKVEKVYQRQVNGDFRSDFLTLPTRILDCAYWLKRMGKPNCYDGMRAELVSVGGRPLR